MFSTKAHSVDARSIRVFQEKEKERAQADLVIYAGEELLRLNERYKEVGGGYFVELNYREQRTATISRNSPEVDEASGEKKSSQKILEAVEADSEITIAQLSEFCGISTRAVQKNIEVLKNRGLLLRIGSDRGGCWRAVGGQKEGS